MILKNKLKYLVSSLVLLSVISIVSIVFIVSASSSVNSKDKLLAVSLIFRHGDRSPINSIANDPNKDAKPWLVGPGELTKTGKLQHYKFGKWLRERYDNFLTEHFDENEVYVRSSDNNRCLMSAASNLAGLFPPKGEDIWTDELLWQPIPIHTMPPQQDDVSEQSFSCKKMAELINAAKQTEDYKKIVKENEDIFETVEKNTGEKLDNDITKLGYLTDTLYIEKLYNLPLPSWTEKVYERMLKLHVKSFELLTASPELTKISIGRFLNIVSNQFGYFSGDKNVQNKSPKFLMFSAHDDQVFSTLKALKIDVEDVVPYTGSVIFELWQKEDASMYYVQAIYKKIENDAEVLKIKDCDGPCSYAKFFDIIKSAAVTENEYKEECSRSSFNFVNKTM